MSEDKESVVCSCGKRTQVVWAKALDKYVAVNKSWVFNRPGGWNCGKQGHYQKITEEKEAKEGIKGWDY